MGDISNDGPSRTDYAQALANRNAPKGNYANWRPVASADFDQNYEPISPSYPGSVASNYTVKNGDTLQSIARTVWGDSAMWYLIADVNGLASGSTLTAGQVLVIPNKVANIHNNAGTFRPYNPGEAIGDTSPTIPVAPSPPKKKKKCGGFLAIIVAVISIAVTVATGGNAILGNLAGQLAGNILGVQKGFDFKSFATSALTYGLGKIDAIKNFTTSFGNGVGNAVGGGSFGNYANIAAQAVVGNITNQVVGNITGSQQGYSWSSVAISGIGAAAGQFANKQLNTNSITNNVAQDLTRGAVNAGAFALSQVVVRGGKVNWQQVATDTILNFTSSTAQRFADANTNNVNKNAQLVAQQNREAGVENEQLFSTAPSQRGAFTQALLDSQSVEAAQLSLTNTQANAGGLSMRYQSPASDGRLVMYNPENGNVADVKNMTISAGAGDVKGRFEAINTGKGDLGFYF